MEFDEKIKIYFGQKRDKIFDLRILIFSALFNFLKIKKKLFWKVWIIPTNFFALLLF